MIIICSFICDIDIFLNHFAKDNNHRNLFSHSIIPSLIIISIGITTNWIALIIAGIAYSLHILIDTFDWGVNLFYFNHKNIGFRLLYSNEEVKNILANFRNSTSFFDFRYYENKVIKLFEIVLFTLMISFVFLFAFEYLYVVIFYFIGLLLHILRYYHLKKVERKFTHQNYRNYSQD